LICQKCGLTLEIEAKKVEAWADEVASEHGFTSPSHTVDIFGLCPKCA
jgi:Fur family ferric uptake transcriptional regulator